MLNCHLDRNSFFFLMSRTQQKYFILLCSCLHICVAKGLFFFRLFLNTTPDDNHNVDVELSVGQARSVLSRNADLFKLTKLPTGNSFVFYFENYLVCLSF